MKKILLVGLTLLSFGAYAQLNGSYTIGGATPNYNTINAAVADLNVQGVSGPVVFNIRTGLYNEQIYLNAVTGASVTNTITFQSETNNANDVTLTYAGDVVVLDSANTVAIKFLTLTTTTSLGKGINIIHKTDNLYVENNVMNLVNGRGVNRDNTASPVLGEFCDTIVIRNNIFNSGYYGIYVDNGATTFQHYMDISNNQILNAKVGGIVIGRIGYDHDSAGNSGLADGGALVVNNIITNDTSKPSFIGMIVTYVQNILEISKNELIIQTTNVGTISGLVAGFVESNNNNVTTNFQNWSNNLTSIDAPLANEVIGIRIQNGNYQNIVHNSFSIKGNSTSSATSVHIAAGGSNLNVINNDFINLTTGALSYAVRTHSAIDPTSSFQMFDFNNFHHLGANFANWLGINVSSFPIYQTTSTFDANSVTINSSFNVDTNNLAILCANLAGLGTPLAYVADDYNGITRSLTAPTIGAIETVSGPIPTVIANATAPTICSGDAVTLTGGGATSYTWDNGVTDGIAINPIVTTTYTVTGTSNGCSNTAQIEVAVDSLPTIIANVTSSNICDGDTIILTGSGGVSYIWDNGVTDGIEVIPTTTTTYHVIGSDGVCSNNAQVTITVNALPAIIANTSADTICGGNAVTLIGAGGLSYTWDNGVIDGAAFNPTATTTYTVIGSDGVCSNTAQVDVVVNTCVGLNEINSASEISFYPNPTNSVVNVQLNNQQITSIRVVDITGKVIETYDHPTKMIDLGNQANGIYFLQVVSVEETTTYKIIKN